MTLDDLEPYFDDFTENDLDDKLPQLFKIFKEDFIDNDFYLFGSKVKIKTMNSNLRGFTNYPEGFVHVITRKSHLKKTRILDLERANRVHWVKVILENSDDSRIKYFKYEEGSGEIRDYFWFREKSYMVVMEKIQPDYLLITGFVVDDEEVRSYEKRYVNYINPNLK